jgi:hypothetical protein
MGRGPPQNPGEPVSLGEAVVEVGADTTRFKSQLSKGIEGAAAGAKNGLNRIPATAGRAGHEAGSNFAHRFKHSIKDLALSGGALVGLVGLEEGLKTVVERAYEAQKATKLTDSVIKSTGSSARVTAKHVEDLGYSISRKVGIDHNAIQSGENLLLTFTKIRNETGKGNRIFDRATKSVVDLGAALAASTGGQVNFRSATTLVGKALQDPIRGLTSLSRVGVFFDDSQKKTIKGLVASGHMMKAQKIILGELQRKFHGAAESQATDSAKAKVAIADLEEEIGKGLLPTVNKLANWATTKAVPAISKFVEEMHSGEGAGGALAADLKILLSVGKGVTSFFTSLPGPVKKTGIELLILGTVVGKVSGSMRAGAASFAAYRSEIALAEGGTAKFKAGLGGVGGVARNVAGAGGILLIADSAGRAGSKLGVLEGAAGGALSGAALGAFAGPVGAGIGAAIGGLAGGALALSRNTKSAGDAAKGSIGDWKTYAGTLDQVSGATTEATRAMILQKAEASGLLAKTRAAGVQDRAVVNAILNGGKARDNVAAAIKREVAAMDASIAAKKADLAANIAIASDNSISLAEQTKAANRNQALRAEIDTMQKKRDAEAKANGTVLAGIGAVQKSITKTQEAAAATRDLTGKLKGIPPLKRTLIEAQGIIPTTKGIVALAEKYQLTPKQVKTVIGATGVQFTQGQIDHMIKLVGIYGKLHPKPTLDLQTALAEAKIHALIAGLGMIKDKTVHVTVSTNSTVAEHAAVGKPKTAIGGVFSGAQTRVIAEAGREAVVPLDRNLSAVNPSVRYLSAIAQGKAIPLPGRAGSSSAAPSPSVSTSATLIVQNPAPETTTQSLPRALSTLSFVLGGG